ncbi:MAG: BMP family ABC transporter substrate-binding protein, partial [Clostridiales bacterium]|nr:BMP family ABC transporter substrate-binding protein [Clostridiales bacterium]
TSAASSATPRPTPASDAPKATPLGAELAFISDFGLLNDGAINQAMWDGLTRCATERGLTYRHYAPTADDGPDAYLDAISRAVSDGAKLIAAPGPLLEVPLYTAQSRYPDVRFILVDGRPHDETFEHETIGQNVACVRFASDQAGFLAGYSAVKSGMRALGFLGAMPVPEITDAGSGFIQGAEYAAAELGLSEDEDGVLIRYGYNGAYRAGAETEALAEVWFADGLDCIFVCGGELGESVAAAAGRLSKKVILYDEDYDGDIENSDNTDTDTAVFARIQKNYEGAVYDGALAFYRGLFPGGKETIRGAVRYGIRLLPPRGPAPGKPASDITDADSTGGTDSEDTPGVSDTAEAVDAPEITDAADILASPEYISLLGALAAEAIPIRRGGGDPFVPVPVAEIPVAVVRVELADAAQ